MEKQLRRVKQGAVLGGVAGGVARYFNVDVVIVRLLFVVSLLISFGVSMFAYIVLWVVLPEEPYYHFGTPEAPIDATPLPEPVTARGDSNGDRNVKIIAIALIGFGTYMLLDQYIEWYHLSKYFWPLALIGIGAFLLLRKRDQEYESSLHSPDKGETGYSAGPTGPGGTPGPGAATPGAATPGAATPGAATPGSSPGNPDDEDTTESFKVN